MACYKDKPELFLAECGQHRISNISASKGSCLIFRMKAENRPVTLVVFRGTTNVDDWKPNLRLWPRLTPLGLMHSGFNDEAEIFPVEYIIRLLKQEHVVIFSGHSRGGAIATIVASRTLTQCSLMGLAHLQSNLLCVSIGAPLVGNVSWANLVNSSESFRSRFLHVVNENDLVPRILTIIFDKLESGLTALAGTMSEPFVLYQCMGTIHQNTEVQENSQSSIDCSLLIAMISTFFRAGEAIIPAIEYRAGGTFVLCQPSGHRVVYDGQQMDRIMGTGADLSSDFGVSHRLHSYGLSFFDSFKHTDQLQAPSFSPIADLVPIVERVSYQAVANRKSCHVCIYGLNLSHVLYVRISGLNSVDCTVFNKVKDGNRSNNIIFLEIPFLKGPKLQQKQNDRVSVHLKTLFDSYRNRTELPDDNHTDFSDVKLSVILENCDQISKMPTSNLIENAALFCLLSSPQSRNLPIFKGLTEALSSVTGAIPLEAMYIFLVESTHPLWFYTVNKLEKFQAPTANLISTVGLKVLAQGLQGIKSEIDWLEKFSKEKDASTASVASVRREHQVKSGTEQESGAETAVESADNKTACRIIDISQQVAIYNSLTGASKVVTFIQEGSSRASMAETATAFSGLCLAAMAVDLALTGGIASISTFGIAAIAGVAVARGAYDLYIANVVTNLETMKADIKKLKALQSELETALSAVSEKADQQLIPQFSGLTLDVLSPLRETEPGIVASHEELISMSALLDNHIKSLDQAEGAIAAANNDVGAIQNGMREVNAAAGCMRNLTNIISMLQFDLDLLPNEATSDTSAPEANFDAARSSAVRKNERTAGRSGGPPAVPDCKEKGREGGRSEGDGGREGGKGAAGGAACYHVDSFRAADNSQYYSQWLDTISFAMNGGVEAASLYIWECLSVAKAADKAKKQQHFRKYRTILGVKYSRVGTVEKKFNSYQDFICWLRQMLFKDESVLDDKSLENIECDIFGVCLNKGITHKTQPKSIVDGWAEFFQDSNSELARLPADYRFHLACRIKLALITYRIRGVMRRVCLLGLFGITRAGKSHLVKALVGSTMSEAIIAGHRASHRTSFPRIYEGTRGLAVLDTVGLNDFNAGIWEYNSAQLMDLCNMRILVTTWQGTSKEDVRILMHTRNGHTTSVPTLTCINKMDLLFEGVVAEDWKYEEISNEGIRIAARDPEAKLDWEIRFEGENPRWPTCFLKTSQAEIPSGLEGKVKTIDDVLKWVEASIKSRTESQG